MIKVIMNGCNGHMGHVISDLIFDDDDMEIVAGIDISGEGDCSYPVYTDIFNCKVNADVMIDFSSYKATNRVLEYCGQRKLPLVLCTTGLTEEQLNLVSKMSRETAILHSANMSLGINVLFKLIQDAAKVLAPAGFDMEIVEKHHRLKKDAPSGTAIALADHLNQALDKQYHYCFDRSQRHEERDSKEIGISSVRGGTIAGDHVVIFAGTDEVITICHQASSKGVFGKGALEAARYLANKPAGLYDMSDVIAG